MKRQFDKKQRLKSKSFRFMVLVVPALLWLTATVARPYVIEPRCLKFPGTCTQESVIPIDQLSLGMEDWKADYYSYWTQNTSGVLAYLVPTTWHTLHFALGSLSGPAALASIGADFLIVSQTIAWNGFFTELSHLISQRPRPFVYSNPPVRGSDPAHYTSFYSGHTSFTAASTLAVFLIFLFRQAPGWVLILSAASFEGLVLATAYFRVLAGRHFLTDVICGAIAGSIVAWAVAYAQRYLTSPPSSKLLS
jgi:membrane-associated phospholipid phosphatase